jgi:hypothetical protein
MSHVDLEPTSTALTSTSCNLADSRSLKVWSSLLPYFDKPPVTDRELQTENVTHISVTVSCSYVTRRVEICPFRVHGDKHNVTELVPQLRNLGRGCQKVPALPWSHRIDIIANSVLRLAIKGGGVEAKGCTLKTSLYACLCSP